MQQSLYAPLRHIGDLLDKYSVLVFIVNDIINLLLFANILYVAKVLIHYQSSFNVIHLATMFKVDIFVLKPDMASQEEMRRREQYQVSESSDHTLLLASAEDVIIHKLYWYQLSGRVSERQWTDVLGVIQVQGEQLDHSYLERMAHQRGVYHLLIEAMKDAEQGGM